MLRELDALTPRDDVDVVTVAAMRERLGLELEIHDAGLAYGDLDVISSPPQTVRDVFDLMPTATADDWSVVATRMTRLPAALDGYVEGLRRAVADGHPPARRQVEAVAAQCDKVADTSKGFFAALAGGARPDGAEPSSSLAADLAAGARGGRRCVRRAWPRVLRDELHAQAREEDACGRDAYALWSRSFLGATVDLDETYAWGREELARVEAEMAQVSDRIVPGGSIEDAVAALDADPARNVEGTDALKAWMQQLSDAAVDSLADVHFDVPDQIRRLECMIAPTQTGGIYYTGPSEDFTRPGRMWWSVPEGVTTFSTWRETTTVYHEGVPGHHLQVGQTLVRSELLNRWRRLMSWSSGHGEGWALYAERLMADLGYLDDPGDRLGHARRIGAARAARRGRHRHPLPDGGAGRGRRRHVGRRQDVVVHAGAQPDGPRVPRVRALPLPRLAGPGAVVQGRRAALAAGPRRRARAAGRRVRPQGLPPPGARPRLARSRRPARRPPALRGTRMPVAGIDAGRT